MSDQTSEPSAPTTNSELGVVGAQAAAAEQQAAGNTPGPVAPVLGTGATLAVEALRLATAQNEPPAEVVSRAKAYLEFLKENSDG